MAEAAQIAEKEGWGLSRRFQAMGEGLYNTASRQKERLFLWVPVLLGTGTGLYFSLPVEPPGALVYGVFFLCLLCWAFFLPLRRYHDARFIVYLFLTAALFVSAGMAAGKRRTEAVAAPVLERAIKTAQIEGTIADIDYLGEGGGVRYILTDAMIEDVPPEKTPRRIRLTVRKTDADAVQPETGDRITVLGGLNPPSAPVSPRGYDFRRQAWFAQIGAYGFAYGMPQIVENDSPEGFNMWIALLREKAGAVIHEHLSGQEEAVAEALMIGERAGISEAVNEAMRASGLFHMLSISGLHIGLIAGCVFMTVRLFLAAVPGVGLRLPVKKYAAFAGLAAAFFYMVLAGASVPAVRALIMTAVVLLAIILDRVAISMRLVAVAALAVLVMTPEALPGPSFQMSFAAVAALIFFYDMVKDRWTAFYRAAGIFRRIVMYVAGVCLTTVVATIATAPFSLFHFQNLALYSLFANVLAMPLVSFIVMPMAVLAFAVMPIGLAEWPLRVMGWGVARVIEVAEAVEAMPGAVWTPPAWPLAALVGFVAAGLIVMLWHGRGRCAAAVPLFFAIAVIAAHRPPDILVSSSGKLIAVRDAEQGLLVSSRRNDRFSAETWARENGQAAETLGYWGDGKDIACDEFGCRFVHDGKNIAVSYAFSAQREDCTIADIVISVVPMKKPCAAHVVIDRYDLKDKGAHAVWVESGRIESVASVYGRRPWTGNNAR